MERSSASEQERIDRDDDLYERFGKPLEGDHEGEFVAISSKGETIVGPDDIGILQQALDRFGSGNFAFRRVGEAALGKWRGLSRD